jgi:uncharacterized sporulation protein YeaH/YhbH (DUF444 family)
VFAAGDGENWQDDSKENVVPLMEEISANLHAYVEVQPKDQALGALGNSHLEIVEGEIGDRDNVATYLVEQEEDVMDCIYELLSTEDSE